MAKEQASPFPATQQHMAVLPILTPLLLSNTIKGKSRLLQPELEQVRLSPHHPMGKQTQ